MKIKIDDNVITFVALKNHTYSKQWIHLKKLSKDQKKQIYTVKSIDIEDEFAEVIDKNKKIRHFPLNHLIIVKEDGYVSIPDLSMPYL